MFSQYFQRISQAFGHAWMLIMFTFAVIKERVTYFYYSLAVAFMAALMLPGAARASVLVLGAIEERCGTANAFKPGAERIAGEFLGLRIFAVPVAVICAICLMFAFKAKGARNALTGTLAGVFLGAVLVAGIPTAADAWVNSKCEE